MSKNYNFFLEYRFYSKIMVIRFLVTLAVRNPIMPFLCDPFALTKKSLSPKKYNQI